MLIFKSFSSTVCPNVASLLLCSGPPIQFLGSQLSFLKSTVVTGPVGVRYYSNVEGPATTRQGHQWVGLALASC